MERFGLSYEGLMFLMPWSRVSSPQAGWICADTMAHPHGMMTSVSRADWPPPPNRLTACVLRLMVLKSGHPLPSYPRSKREPISRMIKPQRAANRRR